MQRIPFNTGTTYTSPNTTISSGLVLPLPHGLGQYPSITQAQIVCITPELNYTAFDRVTLSNGTAAGGCVLAADSTNVTVFLQSLPIIPNKTTGTPTAITAANWKLIVRAWA